MVLALNHYNAQRRVASLLANLISADVLSDLPPLAFSGLLGGGVHDGLLEWSGSCD